MLTYKMHLPAYPRDDQPLLVLMHGRGTDENDLLSLAEFFPDVLFVAPRAPYAGGPLGYGGGYAWYRYLGGTRPDPEHFEHSQSELLALLDHLPAALPVKPGPIFLGGFSQGGTMSLGFGLRNPGRARIVLNLSGFLPDHPSVQVSAETVADTCFYWPHGLHDPSVPFSFAEAGRAQLLAARACLAAPDYPIGHTIIREEIDDIVEIIKNTH